MAEGFSSKAFEDDPVLYLYTSLTSGSSHIVTATSRMETILKANKIPFKAIDIATDDKARMLWGRRAGKDESGRVRKIPGLVQEGFVVGDLVEVEDWNEYGELKQHVTIYHEGGAPPKAAVPAMTPKAAVSQEENVKPTSTMAAKVEEVLNDPANAMTLAMRQLGQEAAQKAKEGLKKIETLVGVGTAVAAKEDKTDKSSVVAETGGPIDDKAYMQTASTTAWDFELPAKSMAEGSVKQLESMQSPNSTAWKQTIPIPPSKSSEAPEVPAEEATAEKDDEDAPEDE